MEAWEHLFEDLSALPAHAPSPAFRERILETLPRRTGAAARVRGWLGLEGEATAHIGSPRLQDFMDRRLGARTAARVEAHLDACAVCRLELDGFRAVARSLEYLPRLEPSADFAERVLAEVRIGQLARTVQAPTTTRERVLAWLRRAVPSTPRGWAGALGTTVAPVATLALVVYTVFSHPLVTLGNLLSFAWLKGSNLADRVVDGVSAPVRDNALVLEAWALVEQTLQSPTLTAAAAALMSGLTMAALWILYRNVFASHLEDGGYAHLSI
jgi:hypothetical protein